MDWTRDIATEVATGEREIGTDEELERLEAKAEERANE